MRKSIFWIVVVVWMAFFIMMATSGCGDSQSVNPITVQMEDRSSRQGWLRLEVFQDYNMIFGEHLTYSGEIEFRTGNGYYFIIAGYIANTDSAFFTLNSVNYTITESFFKEIDLQPNIKYKLTYNIR